jgi:DNA-binding FadR family transcriptional regulator
VTDRLHRLIVTALIEEIAGGELEPGELLPREQDVASHFQLSRGITREAIRALEERGMVSVKHGRGATVNPPADWDLLHPDVLAGLLAGPRADDVLAAAIECRLIVETEAAALAAERSGEEDRAALVKSLESMTHAAQRRRLTPLAEQAYREGELNFHRALVRASRNAALARLAEPLQRAVQMAQPPRWGGRAALKRGIAERERILQAVEQRDADEARNAMREHLASLADELQEGARPGA